MRYCWRDLSSPSSLRQRHDEALQDVKIRSINFTVKNKVSTVHWCTTDDLLSSYFISLLSYQSIEVTNKYKVNSNHLLTLYPRHNLKLKKKMQQLTLMTFLVAAVAVVPSLTSITAFVPTQRIVRATPVLFMAEAVEETTADATDKMKKSIDSLYLNMNSVRTGRASPAILDRVKAQYYGTETPINQMATISVPSSQQLMVDPFDKTALGDIERAIVEADIGLTPQNDGSIIRLNIPALTEDRRKEMMKQCRAIGEEGKVSIRNIRRKAVETIKKLEKSGDIGEDESKSTQDDIQKMTDKNVKEIDDIVDRKEKEVMTV